MRADAIARVSVFAAARHAGRAHAAAHRALIKERARVLRDKGEAAFRAHLAAQVGERRMVLTERGGVGHTEQFTTVRLAAPVEPGVFLDLTMAGHDGRQLLAAQRTIPKSGNRFSGKIVRK